MWQPHRTDTMLTFHHYLADVFNIPWLIIGLLLWPIAVYTIHLFCHAYGLLWQ